MDRGDFPLSNFYYSKFLVRLRGTGTIDERRTRTTIQLYAYLVVINTTEMHRFLDSLVCKNIYRGTMGERRVCLKILRLVMGSRRSRGERESRCPCQARGGR